MNKKLEDLECEGLKIYQDKDGYNFTSDAVLLANYFKANTKETVVELCSGSGVISILGTKKTGAKHFYCFEIQKDVAELCRDSIEHNKIENITVFNSPLADAPKILAGKKIDVVVVNPPYFTEDKTSENNKIALSTHEIATNLTEICQTASKLLKYGGKLYMVHTVSRLAEVCNTLINNNLEPKNITLVRPTKNKPYSVFLLTATKGGKTGLTIDEIVQNS